MDPSSSETAGIELPPPPAEKGKTPSSTAETAAPAIEQVGEVTGERPSAGTNAAAPAAIPLPPAPASVAQLAAAPAATPVTDPAAILDDNDLIEKEWVNKAKAIVEKTRDDPHKQSEELTLVKADYMKKKYDKTIKLK